MNMRPLLFALRSLAVAALVLAASSLASAKTEPETAAKKPAADAPPIRFAHTSAEGMAEAKDRVAKDLIDVVADLDAWLKANPMPAAAPPVK